MTIKNMTQNNILALNVVLADTFLTRLKGLLATKQLETGKGLVIRPCSSIHTVGMNYDIDVVFVGSDDNVLKVVSNMPANRFALCRKSSYIIELPAGTIEATVTTVGDKISLIYDSKI